MNTKEFEVDAGFASVISTYGVPRLREVARSAEIGHKRQRLSQEELLFVREQLAYKRLEAGQQAFLQHLEADNEEDDHPAKKKQKISDEDEDSAAATQSVRRERKIYGPINSDACFYFYADVIGVKTVEASM